MKLKTVPVFLGFGELMFPGDGDAFWAKPNVGVTKHQYVMEVPMLPKGLFIWGASKYTRIEKASVGMEYQSLFGSSSCRASRFAPPESYQFETFQSVVRNHTNKSGRRSSYLVPMSLIFQGSLPEPNLCWSHAQRGETIQLEVRGPFLGAIIWGNAYVEDGRRQSVEKTKEI